LVLVYIPAGQLLIRVAAPIEFSIDTPPFKRLDVVLVNRWAFAVSSPRRGDVVLFSPLNTSRLRVADYQLAHAWFAFEENQLIDRLIALAGDHVVWDKGTLTVNGAPVTWKPLLFERLPPHLEITVPADRYLIWPTTSAAASAGPMPFWKDGSLIPGGDILGGVYLRSNPLSRWWFIR
jgi:signal peptidase I